MRAAAPAPSVGPSSTPAPVASTRWPSASPGRSSTRISSRAAPGSGRTTSTAWPRPTRHSPTTAGKSAAPMSRPILAVDVDGVISLCGFDTPPPPTEANYQLVDGMLHCISLRAGERLQRLGKHFELVWATGWEEKANFYLPTLLGLAELPH